MKSIALLALIVASLHAHSDVFSCEKYSPADFKRALATQKRKFEADIKKWTTEEQIHNSMRENDSSLMNLLLWPELLEGKLFYFGAFQTCAKAASAYINTLSAEGSNQAQLASWKECMSIMYHREKPAPAVELEKCFAKFERK